ncbi:PREDICTED: uncharacterized protein LOC108372667 [Rhagoletis zephyria]|uniref:uncharacterized protein LOC108372667 n=1 Tax=Rhagoletis zephyria TaxID=28612 RepID=UPI0008114A82|nr:PREDICTED: uncharacterized protein LOC108372667 [Rhagoletis zephyria]XP_036340623.1 uncharacterized protein LOC118749987 [Rhagoletis pomonella]
MRGCNAPGVTRANCPKCSNKPSTGHGAVNFNSLTIPIGRNIAIANVQLFGLPGQVYFDSGARTSVASANLKRIMDFKGNQLISKMFSLFLFFFRLERNSEYQITIVAERNAGT